MAFFDHLAPESTLEKKEKTIMLISSTSWTKDEVFFFFFFFNNFAKKDFGVVFKALEMYEDHTKNEGLTHNFPKIILYITGK